MYRRTEMVLLDADDPKYQSKVAQCLGICFFVQPGEPLE
jgi:hypothetical protein